MVKDMKEPLLPLFSIHLISVQFQHLSSMLMSALSLPESFIQGNLNR